MAPIAAVHKVFVVEDSPSVRRRLVELLGGMEGVSVVGEAETPQEAITGIFRTLPDCVVLDFRLVGGTALDVLHGVHPALPDVAFIVLTNHPSAQYQRASIEAGAVAFLDKSSELVALAEWVARCLPTRTDGATHDG